MDNHAQLTKLLNGLAIGEQNGRAIADILLGHAAPVAREPEPVAKPEPEPVYDDE